jgi:hypothetical protein
MNRWTDLEKTEKVGGKIANLERISVYAAPIIEFENHRYRIAVAEKKASDHLPTNLRGANLVPVPWTSEGSNCRA